MARSGTSLFDTAEWPGPVGGCRGAWRTPHEKRSEAAISARSMLREGYEAAVRRREPTGSEVEGPEVLPEVDMKPLESRVSSVVPGHRHQSDSDSLSPRS